VPGARAGEDLRAIAERLGHADRHAPILEAAGRVLAFVLQEELVEPGVGAHARRRVEAGLALLARDDGVERRSRMDELAVAPDAAPIGAAAGEAPLAEERPELGHLLDLEADLGERVAARAADRALVEAVVAADAGERLREGGHGRFQRRA